MRLARINDRPRRLRRPSRALQSPRGTGPFDELVGAAMHASPSRCARASCRSRLSSARCCRWCPRTPPTYIRVADREREALERTGNCGGRRHEPRTPSRIRNGALWPDSRSPVAQRNLSVMPRQARGPRAAGRRQPRPPRTTTKQALDIDQRLADQDPTNTSAQRDLGISHDRLGDIALQAGDTRRATHYQAALTSPAPRRARRHGQHRPTRPQRQPQQARRLRAANRRQPPPASALQDRLRHPSAPRRPRPRQRQRPARPQRQPQRSSVTSRGEPATARPPPVTTPARARHRQRLADQDPTNATAQRDLSVGHNKLGDLARKPATAPRRPAPLPTPLDILQRLADQDPTTPPPNATSASATTSSATSRYKPVTAETAPRTYPSAFARSVIVSLRKTQRTPPSNAT